MRSSRWVRRAAAVAAPLALVGTGTVLLALPAFAAPVLTGHSACNFSSTSGTVTVSVTGSGLNPVADTLALVPSNGALATYALSSTTGSATGSTTSLSAPIAISKAAPGTYNIRVTEAGTNATSYLFNACAIAAPPPSVSGTAAISTNGDTLAVSGGHFAFGDSVAFDLGGVANQPDAGLVFTPDFSHFTTTSLPGVLAAKTRSDGTPVFTPGPHTVTVTHADGDFSTETVTFTQPYLTGVTEPRLGQGATSHPVTLTGAGFSAAQTVAVSPTGNTTDVTAGPVTSVNTAGTALVVPLSATSGAGTQTRDVTVSDPSGGVWTLAKALAIDAAPSVTQCQTPAAPTPTSTPCTPATEGAGATAVSQTFSGTGFLSGAVVTLADASGAAVPGLVAGPATVASSSSLSTPVTVPQGQAPGDYTVTVTNPDGGVGTATPSSSQTGSSTAFHINAGPVISAVSPQGVTPATATTVTVNGSNLENGAAVTVLHADGTLDTAVSCGYANGTCAIASATGTTQRTISVTAPVTDSGVHSVRVVNPDGGVFTLADAFSVNNLSVTKVGNASGSLASNGPGASSSPAAATQLTLSVASPAASPTLAGPFTATLTPSATNDQPQQQPAVTLTGVTLTSGTGSTPATFTGVADLRVASTGAYDVTLTTNAGQVTYNCVACLTVVSGESVPTVSAVTPGAVGQGASGFPVTVTGTGFTYSDATAISPVLSTSAGDITSRVVSVDPAGTSLVLAVSVPQTETTTSSSTPPQRLKITNSQGSVSCGSTTAGCVTIDPAPVLSGDNVSSAQGANSANRPVTFTGTNLAGPVLTFTTGAGTADDAITVGTATATSATSVTVPVSIAGSAAAGRRGVTAVNSADGGRTASSYPFTVDAAPVLSGSSPSVVPATNTAVALTVSGSNFQTSASPIRLSATDVTFAAPSNVTATSLSSSATAPTTLSAARGSRDLTLVNPDAGTATCAGCLQVITRPAGLGTPSASTADNTITVRFPAATDDGGGTISAYRVTITQTGVSGTPATRTAGLSGATPAPVTFGGLPYGTTWSATYEAVNAAGASDPSAASNVVAVRYTTAASITSSAPGITYGKPVLLYGTVSRGGSSQAATGAVGLFGRFADGRLRYYGSENLDAGGHYAFAVTPLYTSTFYAAFQGSSYDLAVQSPMLRVTVAATVVRTNPTASTVTIAASQNYVQDGQVGPFKGSGVVSLYNYGASGARSLVLTAPLDRYGRFVINHRFLRGYYRFTINYPDTLDNTAGRCALYALQVR